MTSDDKAEVEEIIKGTKTAKKEIEKIETERNISNRK